MNYILVGCPCYKSDNFLVRPSGSWPSLSEKHSPFFLTKLSSTKRWTKTALEEEKLIVHTFYIKITNVVILLSCVLVLCASSRQCINNPAIHIYKLIQYHKPLKTLAWFKITGLLSIFPRLKVSLLCFYNFIQTVYYDL